MTPLPALTYRTFLTYSSLFAFFLLNVDVILMARSAPATRRPDICALSADLCENDCRGIPCLLEHLVKSLLNRLKAERNSWFFDDQADDGQCDVF